MPSDAQFLAPQVRKRAWANLERAKLLLDEYRFKNARIDPNCFMEYCMPTEEDPSRYVVQGSVHREAHGFCIANNQRVIIFPRGHGKTNNFVVGRKAWQIGNHPEAIRHIICATDGLANDRVKAIRELMETDRYKHVFPEISVRGGSTRFDVLVNGRKLGVQKEPTIAGSGVFSSTTGRRSHDLTFDDIVDMRNAITEPALREKVKQTFYGSWLMLLIPGGELTYIATPWHRADLTSELINNETYPLFFRAVKEGIDGSYIPVWPEKFGDEELQDIKRTTCASPGAFARGYLCRPVADEDLLIKPHWINYWRELPKERGEIIITVDPAITTREGGDYTVIMVCFIDSKKNLYVLYYVRARLDFPTTCETIHQVAEPYRHILKYVGIETVAYQKALTDWIKQKSWLSHFLVEIPRATDKVTRFSHLAIPIKNGKVFLRANENGVVHRSQAELHEELTSISFAGALSEHDDTVDALADAVKLAIAPKDIRYQDMGSMLYDAIPGGN